MIVSSRNHREPGTRPGHRNRPATMHVDDAITSRRSIRRFLPTPVPLETVEHLLDVAARAPSGHDIQPWRVYALAGASRARLCDAIVAAARSDAQRHQPEYEHYPITGREPARAFTHFAGFDDGPTAR
jgi:nitroreductase